MKKTLSMLSVALGVLFSGVSPAAARPANPELSGGISLSGAWALYPMAVRWAEEFQKLHPKVRIDVQAGGAGKGIADVLAGMVDIGMVSRDVYPAEIAKGALPLAVTKDAVLPTVSAKNPFLREIRKRGIKRDEFLRLWITRDLKTWEELFGKKGKAGIHVYTRADACGAAETWAAYLGKRQEDLAGVGVYGDPGLADAVRRDALGIGYNNVNFAYDAQTKKPIDGIQIVPIDLDGNGVLDPAEDVYRTRDEITRAIAEDVYPSPPARELYFVIKGVPKNQILVEFLRWTLTEGQKYVPETGYINLSQGKLAEGLAKIGAGR